MSDANKNIHFMSQSDEYPTPDAIFQQINERYGPFDCDCAATAENAKCPKFWTIEDDALSKPWYGRDFLNAPYSKIAAFVEHAIRETQSGCVSRLMSDSSTSDVGQHYDACRTPLRGMSDTSTSDAGQF